MGPPPTWLGGKQSIFLPKPDVTGAPALMTAPGGHCPLHTQEPDRTDLPWDSPHPAVPTGPAAAGALSSLGSVKLTQAPTGLLFHAHRDI